MDTAGRGHHHGAGGHADVGEHGTLWVSGGVSRRTRVPRWTRIVAAIAGVVAVGIAGVVAWSTVSTTVEVLADGDAVVVRSFGGDVAEALARASIEVGESDLVDPPPTAVVQDGMQVVVTRARTIEVHADGSAIAVETTADTVAAALQVAGVSVSERDLIEPGPTEVLNGSTVITVQRVADGTDVVELPIEHSERREETAELPKGESRVKAEGEDGLRRETYELIMVDGQEADRELVSDEVVREPVDRVVLDGVGPTPLEQAQARLAELGYPVGAVDGVEGPQTRRALCAWRRLEGRNVSRQGLQPGELEALRASSGLPSAAAGRGATADRTCQTLYYRQDGRWRNVHAASTGADGLPSPGEYRIQRARAGWHTSTLYPADNPNMYNTLYIRGAIAIHGSHHVPAHPASKGCVRVTPSAADQLFSALSVGDPVSVVGT